MAATTTKIVIVNRGLQLLGSQSISSLNENSRGAKAMLRAYDSIFLAELEANTWKFSIKRASLVANATPPLFGKSKSYPLPGDFLYLAPEETTLGNPQARDWEIEGSSIYTNDGSPIHVRYVSSNITESDFSPLFAEAFSASLAMATCEEITNSNTKKADARAYYDEIIKRAKKRNDLQKPPVKSPTCSWISVRL